MPARTLRYAVARLREEGVLVARRSLRDARRRLLFLSPEGAEDAPPSPPRTREAGGP